MIILSNSNIKISILDPYSDTCHFGSRYCTGGYIWQIHHEEYGNLLSGPQYPSENPPQFDGQGVPEVFEFAPDADSVPIGESVVVPGVGMVKKTSPILQFHVRDNPEVVEFCKWDIKKSFNSIIMSTLQTYKNFRWEIIRTISLDKSTILSRTEFKNSGSEPFKICWFAHPFFPLNPDKKCCGFSVPISIPENHAFRLDKDNVLYIKDSINRSISSFTLLNIPGDKHINVYQYHSSAGTIAVSPDFVISKMPVWTNENTFSFEPYFMGNVYSGGVMSWGIKYILDSELSQLNKLEQRI